MLAYSSRITVFCAICTTVTSCSLGFDEPPSRAEVSRVTNPTGDHASVLIETNGGATTSFGYAAFIESNATHELVQVAEFYGAVRNNGAYGVDLVWKDDETLDLWYLSARRASLLKPSIEFPKRVFHIELVSGVENKNAPAGGMEYNNVKRKQAGKGLDK